ncbi:MAG: hypothetical protein RMK65_11540 [Anaerolineae bacterium]|nr:hypothetical protein [Anaerolineae bacterium]MDW7992726.1 hypothetical protein [Anaerolineae bacterium]
MRRQDILLGGVLLLLILIVAACSPKEQTPAPAPASPVPTTSPTQAATPTPPVEEAPPLEVAPDALENLNSYRSRVIWQNTVEGGATETITVEQEETRDPLARRIRITQEGGESPGALELVQIGNMAWMCSPDGGCIQSQQSAEEAAYTFGEGVLLKPEDLLAFGEYRYVGRDTVNGVRSRHYTLNLPASALAELARGTVTANKADVWVADESGMSAYVTRFVIQWEGTGEDGKKIAGSWTYELYDVNQRFTIQPPAGAPAIPEDIPMCAGFTNQTITGNMILLTCPDSAEAVAEFYRNEMARLGWRAGSESLLGNMVTQEWTKENRKASLMISPGDQGGCMVMITVE